MEVMLGGTLVLTFAGTRLVRGHVIFFARLGNRTGFFYACELFVPRVRIDGFVTGTCVL